jgi:hypothetical protein
LTDHLTGSVASTRPVLEEEKKADSPSMHDEQLNGNHGVAVENAIIGSTETPSMITTGQQIVSTTAGVQEARQ